MLRGRRLPWPQAPLSEWTTTAPTTTALAATAIPRARYLSTPKDLQPEGDRVGHPDRVQQTSQKSKETHQNLGGEGATTRAGPGAGNGTQRRIFRKTVARDGHDKHPDGGADGQIKVKYYHIHPQHRLSTLNGQTDVGQQQSAPPANHFIRIRKFDPEDKKAAKAAIADQARAKPKRSPPSRHIYYTLAGLKPFQGQGTSVKTEDDAAQTGGPQFPLVVKDPATSVPHKWTLGVAKQLGLKPQKSSPAGLKRIIARRLGLKSWAQAPAEVQAAIKARNSSKLKVMRAVTRQTDLKAEGISAAFPHRNYEAVGKPPPFPLRRYPSEPEKPAVDGIVAADTPSPIKLTSSIAVEKPAVDGIVAADTPGSPIKLTSSIAVEKPALKDGFLVGKNLEPLSSHPSGEKKTEKVRFTVLPTWLPWNKVQEMAAAAQTTPSEHVSVKTASGSSMPNNETDGQFQHQQRREGGLASPRDTEPTSLDETTEPAEPAEDKQSIFDMLFVAKRKRARRDIDSLKSLFLDAEGDFDPMARLTNHTPLQPRQTDGSIYRQLFPERPQIEPEEFKQDSMGHILEPPIPPEEPLFVSLRNEVRNWVPDKARHEISAPELGKYGSHSTVIVLAGVSNSLVESDFYRIIPGGKYVEGWAGGLVRIAQARDPLTHEPVGQYFLLFHSRPAAAAYADEVERLHALSRRLLHTPRSSGRILERGKLEHSPTNPQPFLTKDEEAAVRSFTLCSPDMPLRLSVRMWGTEMVGQIASKTNISGVVQQLQPEAETPARVLLTVSEGYGVGTGGMTADELWLTLRDDGRERRAPWVLKNLREGIMPVKTQAIVDAKGKIQLRSEAVAVPVDADTAAAAEEDMVAEPGRGEPSPPHGGESSSSPMGSGTGKDGKVDGKQSFNRFTLTFPQLALARRFVRCWHKRVIWDAELHRSLVIDAVALT